VVTGCLGVCFSACHQPFRCPHNSKQMHPPLISLSLLCGGAKSAARPVIHPKPYQDDCSRCASPCLRAGELSKGQQGTVKSVALIDNYHELGGAGINTGTVPSKTLRETALTLSGARSRKLYGLDLSLRRDATVSEFLRHERAVKASMNSCWQAILPGPIPTSTGGREHSRMRTQFVFERIASLYAPRMSS
jgi:hypothetical protein